MPSLNKLLKFVKGIQVTTGISNIFQLVQIKSNVMDNSSKCCVIFLDELSLRQVIL